MLPPDGVLPSSFRDPHGFVFMRDGVLLRQVNDVHAAAFDHFARSGLYEQLVEERLLIPHVQVDATLGLTSDAAFVLQPEWIPFVSLPYEWSWTQLRDAALLTLTIQERAMANGMTLRDATAFNVTFWRGRPTFIDTTSFGLLEVGRPWVAYRQFCQHFLAPLALMSYRDVRLGQLSRIHLDGVPIDLAARLLPRRAKARPALAMHLSFHARSQRRHANDADHGQERNLSPRAFEGLIASLRRCIDSLPEPPGTSEWRDYYQRLDHYSDAAAAQKESLVGRWVEAVAPSSMWDVGANTGRFSVLGSHRGIETVAIDNDPFCVDEMYRTARRDDDAGLTAAVADIANPTPGIGWANAERPSLRDRGPADLLLALAVLHHIAIGRGVPLPAILDELAVLGRASILEWVPMDDPMSQRLARGREYLFDSYTERAFEDEVARRFEVRRRERLADTGRALLLVEPR